VVDGAEFYIVLRRIGSDGGAAGATIISATYPANMCRVSGNEEDCQMGWGFVQGQGAWVGTYAMRAEGSTKEFHDTGPNPFGSPARGGYNYSLSFSSVSNSLNSTGDIILQEGTGFTSTVAGTDRTSNSFYTQRMVMGASGLHPPINGNYDLGTSSYQFGTVYSVAASLGDIFFDNNFAMTEHHYLGDEMPRGLGLVDLSNPDDPKITAFFGDDGTVYVTDIKDLSTLKVDMKRFRERLKEVKYQPAVKQ